MGALATTVPCGSCETPNPAEARFCMSCGASLEIGCPSCHTALPPGARFCFNCGHEMEAGATAQQPGRPAREVASGIADELRRITQGAGERRRITMLFCDVKDSTATAEGVDPEVWSDIMRETMSLMVEPVERYGGTVARLLGDAILAYFGAPVAHEDDPQRALLAALAMIESTRPLVARVQEQHGTGFDLRVGINTGLVVVGEVGSDRFTEYAAIGDAANVAARMEQTAEPGTIRIAEATHKLIAPLFETRHVGSLVVKGRGEPIDAFEVVAAKGTPGQVRGIEGLAAPLVGRRDELEQLVAAVRDVAAGNGGIVSLLGEAGLGKSRLVSELRREVADLGVHWITAQCHSYEDSTPYAPLVPALHACLGLHEHPTPAARAARVFEVLGALLGDDGRATAAYLCALLELPLLPDDEKLVAFSDPGTLRARVFGAVEALFEGLATAEPVVLEFEDLHWADPTSIELVQHLLALPERTRLVVLLVFRPRRDEGSWTVHELAAREHAARYTAIDLSPLDDRQSRELVAHLLRVEGLSDSVRETILAKAEGNPFFVEEVVRSLLDDGTITREGDRFVATARIDDLGVPDTLAAVLTTRLDQLGPASRSVVQTASVLGREFTGELLGALVDADIDLDAVLSDLQRRELVVEHRREPELVLRFRHALTRDAAYDTLLHSVRRELHRVVGSVIEERHPDRVFDLALHFVEADDSLRAVPYLVQAGEKAFAAFARQDAARYFEQALERWTDVQDTGFARRAFVGLGNAQLFLGDATGSIATFDRMLAFAREHGDEEGEVDALNNSGIVTLLTTGDADAAEQRLLEAKGLAERRDNLDGLAEFHVGYCYLNVSQGRLERAEESLGEMAEVCFSLNAHKRNFGLAHYAGALAYQAKFDEARVAIRRAREQSELDEDLEHLAEVGGTEALVEFSVGNPVRAFELATEGLAIASSVAATAAMPILAWMGAASAAQLGRFEDARRHADVAMQAAEASGNTGPGAASMIVLASIEHALHGAGSATTVEWLDRAREVSAYPMSRALATAVLAGTAGELIPAGRYDAAEEALDEAAQVPSAMSRLARPELPICRASIALLQGDLERAGELFDEAVAIVDQDGLGLYGPRARAGQAAVSALTGDVDGGIDGFREADADAEQRTMRLDRVAVLRTAVDTLTHVGATGAAAAGFRDRLADAVADIAAQLEDHELRRAFLRTHAVAG